MLRFFLPLTKPLGLIWLICLIGAFLCFRKRQRLGGGFLFGAALLISLVGSRIPMYLLTPMEEPYIRRTLETVPEADAIVLLGGMIDISRNDMAGFNVNSAFDRAMTAAELVRLRKAPVLAVGGQTKDVDGALVKESTVVAEWLKRWRLVPEGGSVIEMEHSNDTWDEARHVADLVRERGWKRVILVTSASHMRRAEATFLTAGVPVEPVACDFTRLGIPFKGAFDPFPWENGFALMEVWLHENIGWQVYRQRGWISDDAARSVAHRASVSPKMP
jgi:uncharacterized SAM-binding protein YcdF (DUF218 family)